jgi:hypothetical protein
MQLVTMERCGVTYDLGYIMPIWVENKQQFLIVPTFDFRPPFILLRLERAHLRMELLAKEHFAKGGLIPQLRRAKPISLDPVHKIVA